MSTFKPQIEWEPGAISHPVPQLWLPVFFNVTLYMKYGLVPEDSFYNKGPSGPWYVNRIPRLVFINVPKMHLQYYLIALSIVVPDITGYRLN